jgi:hypothetical protein
VPWQILPEQSMPEVQKLPGVGGGGGLIEHEPNWQLPPGQYSHAAHPSSSATGSYELALSCIPG